MKDRFRRAVTKDVSVAFLGFVNILKYVLLIP